MTAAARRRAAGSCAPLLRVHAARSAPIPLMPRFAMQFATCALPLSIVLFPVSPNPFLRVQIRVSTARTVFYSTSSGRRWYRPRADSVRAAFLAPAATMQYTFVRESFQPSGDKSPAQAPCAIRFRGQRRERAGCVKSRFTALRSVQIGGTAARVERQYAECPLLRVTKKSLDRQSFLK